MSRLPLIVALLLAGCASTGPGGPKPGGAISCPATCQTTYSQCTGGCAATGDSSAQECAVTCDRVLEECLKSCEAPPAGDE
jgi:hypothetical protein